MHKDQQVDYGALNTILDKSHVIFKTYGVIGTYPLFKLDPLKHFVTYYPEIQLSTNTDCYDITIIDKLKANTKKLTEYSVTLERFLTRQCKFTPTKTSSEIKNLAVEIHKLINNGEIKECITQSDFIDMFKVKTGSCMEITTKIEGHNTPLRSFMYNKYNIWPSLLYFYLKSYFDYKAFVYYKNGTPAARFFEDKKYLLDLKVNNALCGSNIKPLLSTKPHRVSQLYFKFPCSLTIPAIYIKNYSHPIFTCPFSDFISFSNTQVKYSKKEDTFKLIAPLDIEIKNTTCVYSMYSTRNFLSYNVKTTEWLSGTKLAVAIINF